MSERARQLLVISPVVPYPADKGEKIRIATLCKLLAKSYQVDLLATSESEDPPQSSLFRKQQAVYLSRSRRFLSLILCYFSGKPLTFSRVNLSGVRSLLRQSDLKKYDKIIIFSSAYAELANSLPTTPAAKIYWDLIDLDSNKWRQYLAHRRLTPLQKYLFQREAKLLERAERQIIEFSECTALISSADLNKLPADLRQAKLAVVGHSHPKNKASRDQTEPRVEAEKNRRFSGLFVGQLNYLPNTDAVRFLAEEIMPLLPAEDFKITVAGRNPGRQIRKLKNLELIANPDTLSSLYCACDFVVIPLTFAFGLPTKLPEAFSFNKPVITNSHLARIFELTHTHDVLIADTPEQYISAIKQLKDKPDLGKTLVANAAKTLHRMQQSLPRQLNNWLD